jgi:hypothetical protein
LTEDAVLAAAFRLMLDVRSAQRKGPAYQIAVTLCGQCKRGWQDGGTKTVEMSPPTIECAMCDAVNLGSVDEVDQPRHQGKTADQPNVSNDQADRTGRRSSEPNRDKPPRATWTIPDATRRKVLRRDHGRCRAPACSSSRNIDVHHIDPTVGHVASNLISLCQSHHLSHHSGALRIQGDAGSAAFTRTHASNYKNATLAVDTAKALRGLGFKPQEVNAAVAQTKTHVGTADLTLEQWIKIALRYCPSG